MSHDDRYMSGLLSGFLERSRLERAASSVQPGMRVLDIACNEGALLEVLPSDVEYVGLDRSEHAIARARERHPQAQFLVTDLSEALPALGEPFDVITVLAFLEHLADPAKLLSDLCPLLKPEGRIVATTPSPHGRRVHDIGAAIGIFSREGADEHETFLGRQQLRQVAAAAGLQMSAYQRFMFTFNQLVVFTRKQVQG